MLAAARAGERLPVVGPLGRGFPAPAAPRALLVAGGVGMPPMLHLAEETQGAADGAPVPELTLLYGGRSREHIHLTDRFFAAGCGVEIATDDGSVGERGPVTVLLERHLAAAPASARPDVFACGPEPMLRAVAAIARRHGARCFIAAEARMACGVGCCRGCAIELSGAGGRIAMCCTDGPVFDAEALYG
jgi:dihydroorotate dehydrogenase electron transfer subunit